MDKNKKNLLILGIIGLAVIVSLFMVLRHKPQKNESSVEEVVRIVETVHKIYANKANFWGLNNESFASNDILRRSLLRSKS